MGCQDHNVNSAMRRHEPLLNHIVDNALGVVHYKHPLFKSRRIGAPKGTFNGDPCGLRRKEFNLVPPNLKCFFSHSFTIYTSVYATETFGGIQFEAAQVFAASCLAFFSAAL